jgi:hypothetical protein
MHRKEILTKGCQAYLWQNEKLAGILLISARAWQNVNGREVTSPFQEPKSQRKFFPDVRFGLSKFRHTEASKVRT